MVRDLFAIAMIPLLLFILIVTLPEPGFPDVNNETAYFSVRLEVTSQAAVCAPVSESGRTAVRVFVTVEEGSIRYMYHGGRPTVGSGHLATSGTAFALDGAQNVRNLCFIAVSGDVQVELTLEAE